MSSPIWHIVVNGCLGNCVISGTVESCFESEAILVEMLSDGARDHAAKLSQWTFFKQ